MKQIIDIGTLCIAMLALALSTCSYVRENERAESIAKKEEVRANAQVKPYLYIIERRYDKGFGIRLKNAGIGPAFIEEAVFEKNGKTTNYLKELFSELDAEKWDDYVSLPQGVILESGKSWDLVKLSDIKLKPKYLNIEKGIQFNIHYKDIYGNEMAASSGVLSGR